MDDERNANLPAPIDDPQWRHLLHIRFSNEYLKCGNALEAARRAGYQAPSDAALQKIANRLLQRNDVQNYVATHLQAGMTPEEAAATLCSMIRGSMADFIHIDANGQPSLDLGKLEAQENLHLIKKLTPTKNGWSLELYSKLEALGLLMRHIEVRDRATMQRRTAEEFLSQLPPEMQDQVRRILTGGDDGVIEGERADDHGEPADLSFLGDEGATGG